MVRLIVSMISKIKDIFINCIKRFKALLVSVIVILSLLLGINFAIRNNYKQQQQQLFTEKINLISKNLKNGQLKKAKELLFSINEKVLEKNIKVLVSFLKTVLKMKSNFVYTPTEITYDDSSIFGTLLHNKSFIDLLQKKQFKTIVNKYLNPSIQSSPEILPFLCYMKSLQSVYGSNSALNCFMKQVMMFNRNEQVLAKEALEAIILKK